MIKTDVLIIGAGASGLMCAIEAGKRGRHVIILEHANKPGKKILMSGGGRCNFTNQTVSSINYISRNPHFCKSALSRFSQWDFIQKVQNHGIDYHERDHGQLFCNHSSKDILQMLLKECSQAAVSIHLNSAIDSVHKTENEHFMVQSGEQFYLTESLVIASGGLSIPKIGASPIGYKIAEQFNIPVWPTSAGLVPFTLHNNDKQKLSELSGIAVFSTVKYKDTEFSENILFTHRGLSGPAILQISNYWQPGESIFIDMLPFISSATELRASNNDRSSKRMIKILTNWLPRNLLKTFVPDELLQLNIADISEVQLSKVLELLKKWELKPNATEGYRTAEVTRGGVDCDAISSKTFSCRGVSGLYFIGEVLDVTGWLGGYNFQWAWSSGWCAGQYV